MTEHVRTLSLTQPWASLIALGEKKIETRDWKNGYRGVIAIHASAHIPKWARDYVDQEALFAFHLAAHGIINVKQLPLGQIVAMGILTKIVRTEDLREKINFKELTFGDYSKGRYGWCLEEVHKLDYFETVKGQLGLWTWEIPTGSPAEDLYLYLKTRVGNY